jgi:hypothetical protein
MKSCPVDLATGINDELIWFASLKCDLFTNKSCESTVVLPQVVQKPL